MVRSGATLEPVAWHDVGPKLRDAIQSAGSSDPSSVRFLVSAHASTEELFVLKEVVTGLLGNDGMNAVTMTWKNSREEAARGSEVHRAYDGCAQRQWRARCGLRRRPGQRARGGYLSPSHRNRLGTRQSCVCGGSWAGRFPRRCVMADRRSPGRGDFAPRRAGSRDVGACCSSRHRAARSGLGREGRDLHERSGESAGRVASDCAAGRGHGRLADPGELRPTPRVCLSPYQTSSDVRKAIAGALPAAYADADKVPFTRPIPARNWLQASNPSERWKWDFLYQDLPPVKGHNVQMEEAAAFIPLKPVG